ncbi:MULTISPECIES: phage/plasmid primase, P4 family [Bradyrhizobium]|nr:MULTISPECIES: phage/plasmid primase, P4 family [Bradyrhizobium]
MSRYSEFDAHSDFDWDEPLWPREVGYDPSKHASNNAHRFLCAREEHAPLICSDGDLYTLEPNNVWRLIADSEVAAEIRKTDTEIRLDISKLEAMVREMKIARGVSARPFEWIKARGDAPSPNDLILSNSGILNVATGELIDLTPDYFATGVPDWSFEPDADCPLWESKLSEWLDPSFHLTLQEWFGLNLVPDTSFEKIAAMIGASRGGKGTIKGILEQLVGRHHRASIMLNDLGGDFGLQAMIDKRLMIIPDASDTELSKRSMALERMKSISGNDAVSVNRKNKPILSLRIPAKITLLANKHPKFIDESGALAIRELMFVFDRSFAGKEDLTLKTRLTDELPGIANWAIEGLKRLRRNGKFTIGERGRVAQEQLTDSQSPALRFTKECLTATGDEGDVLPVALAFDAYREWADRESLGMRERRNRSDFKDDMLAALRARGVRYASNQVRWRDPHLSKPGKGERVKARFVGLKLKREFHPELQSP